jgi:CBS domain-containing protein
MIDHGMFGRVGQLMTRDPLVVTDDAPLLDAAELMDTFDVTGLPVVDDTGAIVGVISQTDLVRAAAAQHLWSGWPGLAVRHLMTSPAVTVRAETALDEAAQLMESERIHRLVVVADDGRTPIGVLSLSDFVRMLAEDGETDGV